MKTISHYLLLIFSLCTITSPLFGQWVEIGPGNSETISTIAVIDTKIFVGTRYSGAYLSTDDGNSWNGINSGLTSTVLAFAFIDSSVFAGTESHGVSRSTNNGTNWNDAGLASEQINSLAVSGTNLFAGTDKDGVYLSSDYGKSWTQVDSGLADTQVFSLFISGRDIFAGTGSGVYLSTNNGTTWALSGLEGRGDWYFGANETYLYTIAGNSAYFSNDSGKTWNALSSSLPSGPVCLALDGTNIFYASQGNDLTYTGFGVYLSTNNGASWTDTQMLNTTVYPLVFDGAYLLAGTGCCCVWRRPLSEMISSVRGASGVPSREFSLKPNYPNPFNPSTTISYQLPTQSQVTLKVFDVLGREVATLVNGEQTVGYKSVTWNAANVPSGIYFYRLQAGTFTETKKLLLLR